jgi:tetratricopeptide (TPR) repeat protein
VWQELRSELHPRGLEIVTVALDTGGPDAARPWIEAAKPEHPSLIDQAHLLDELFGIVNVPSGVWIDEAGMIVRPPEPAFPIRRQPAGARREPPPDAPPRMLALIEAVSKIRIDPETYVAALRDWVANGAASRYALSPDEVIERSQPRGVDEATAAAHFELGQHLYRAGRQDEAVPHFREAHRLQPDNWTYKRQAWTFADPGQGPTDLYEGNWLDDVQKLGAENYYPPLKM